MESLNKKILKIAVIGILIIIFSLALRLDLNNYYPKGTDTYEISVLSKNIQEKGYIVWNLDLVTALGLTSFSYPPGGIIFLAELSSLTGLDIIFTILIWSFFLIIICGLFVFLISNEIFNNNIISFLAVLIYLNTRFFIAYSSSFTTRNILHVIFLGILFLLIKGLNFKKILLIGALIVVSFFTHRATILIGIFIVSYFFSKLLYKFYKNKMSHSFIILILGISMFLVSVYFFGHANIGTETTKIPFEIGIRYIDDLLSIIFSLSMHFGILLVLLPFGYLLLLVKKEKSHNDFFILISVTLAAGFVVETIYFFYIFLPLMVIVIAYFFEYLFSLKKHIRNISIYLTIIALVFPLYITITDTQSDITFIRDQTTGLTSFLNNKMTEKSVICNNHAIYCAQISTLSKNVTALTRTSGLTMTEKISINKSKVILGAIRNKVIVQDNILDVSLFPDTYTSAIINWDMNKPTLEKLIGFTNLGYIIDSNNPDSIRNKPKIQRKFGDMNQIYDNGLQQVRVIE